MTETPKNPFIINLVETSYHRRPCTVCGGWTEKHGIKAENPRDVSPRIRVCETCLEAGNVDVRLLGYADALEKQASQLRALVGRLKVPTFAEWQAANKEAEAAYAKSYYADAPPAESDVVRLPVEGFNNDLDADLPF